MKGDFVLHNDTPLGRKAHNPKHCVPSAPHTQTWGRPAPVGPSATSMRNQNTGWNLSLLRTGQQKYQIYNATSAEVHPAPAMSPHGASPTRLLSPPLPMAERSSNVGVFKPHRLAAPFCRWAQSSSLSQSSYLLELRFQGHCPSGLSQCVHRMCDCHYAQTCCCWAKEDLRTVHKLSWEHAWLEHWALGERASGPTVLPPGCAAPGMSVNLSETHLLYMPNRRGRVSASSQG